MNANRKALLADVGLLVMRLAFGGTMMLVHGSRKLLDGSAADFADPIGVGPSASYWLAVFAEFVCGGLVVLGLGTRAAVLPLISTMLVAATIVHATDPFARKELAIVYLAAFVTLLLTGAGRFSIDGWLEKRRETKK